MFRYRLAFIARVLYTLFSLAIIVFLTGMGFFFVRRMDKEAFESIDIALAWPFFAGAVIILVIIVYAGHKVTQSLVIKPLTMIDESTASLLENPGQKLYGTTRLDEFGDLARTIQRIFHTAGDSFATVNALITERDRQMKMMKSIDEAAFALLAIHDEDDAQFNQSLREGISTIAANTGTDSLFVWKNEWVDGEPGYTAKLNWKRTLPEGIKNIGDIRYRYSQTPGWGELFRRGEIVNSPVEKLDDLGEVILGDEIQSILIIPVFMQEHFWGTVSFGDYEQARYFTHDQVNLLRSAAMMIVSAVNRQEQAARINEINARAKKMLNTTPICCVIWNRAGEIIDFNEEARGFFRAETLDEIQGRFYRYIPPYQIGGYDSLSMLDKNRVSAYEDGEITFDFAYNKPETGEIIPATVLMIRMDYDDGERVVAQYSLGTIDNVRIMAEYEDRGRRLEVALVAAQAASRAKGDFLATMSHEMRTPMNAIIGMTAIGRESPEMERKDYAFDRIETASRHLLAVINDVLDMSRIEAGKLELVNEPFGLENTFQRVFNVVSFRLEEKRQRYTTGLDPHIPRLLLGDEQRLVQVLTNLLSNAVKFTPEGKDIRMEAHLVGREDDVVSVRFEVCDEGIGISREQQERLFQSFEQAETSTTRRYGGSGLGLAISKHIVEMMGGCIWVESDLGKGARFCFTVGLAEGKDTEAVAVEIERMKGEGKDAVPDYRGKRLLLAEDVEINQEIVTAMLEPTGITIHCAATGDEALRMFEASVSAESFAYDLIFMDVHMPVMDGYEVTRLIRGLPYPEASTVPIIAMTANVFQDDIDKCLKSGMNAHLGKPLAYREMMAAVRRYLGAGA